MKTNYEHIGICTLDKTEKEMKPNQQKRRKVRRTQEFFGSNFRRIFLASCESIRHEKKCTCNRHFSRSQVRFPKDKKGNENKTSGYGNPILKDLGAIFQSPIVSKEHTPKARRLRNL